MPLDQTEVLTAVVSLVGVVTAAVIAARAQRTLKHSKDDFSHVRDQIQTEIRANTADMRAEVSAMGEKVNTVGKKTDSLSLRMDKFSEIQQDHTMQEIELRKHDEVQDRQIEHLSKSVVSKAYLDAKVAEITTRLEQFKSEVDGHFEYAEESLRYISDEALHQHVVDCPVRTGSSDTKK